MRASVAAAWPAFCQRWEGRLSWMYLDTKRKVTTGTGNLIDSVAEAQALPWLRADGTRATPAQIEAEWRRVKALTALAPRSGWAFEDSATLHLSGATVDRLLKAKTAEFWAGLKRSLPAIESWPADAQLAVLDTAWQNGPAFLELRKLGRYVWRGTRAALLGLDFEAAASHVPDPHPDAGDDDQRDRAEARKRLYRNAAKVLALKLDPEVLWDTRTPTAPKVPAPVTPPQEKIMHHRTWGAFVRFRGAAVPPKTDLVLRAIPTTVVPTQGGLSDVVPESANTHVGIGAYDLSTRGMNRKRTRAYAAELIRSGECAYPRGGLFGSWFFVPHLHVVSDNCPRSSLHPEARVQLDDFKATPRRNGLAGHGRYVGPSTPLGSWETSPYNPKNIRELPKGERTYYVVSGTLQGLTIDRKPKGPGFVRKRGHKLVGVRLVRRWGRWNLVTRHGTYYAVKDRTQTYLSTTKPA